MKLRNNYRTNNYLQVNNSKGDLYAIPSYKSTLTQKVESTSQVGAICMDRSLSKNDFQNPAERSKVGQFQITNYIINFSQPKANKPLAQKRSNIMKATQFLTRGFIALLSICLMAGLVFGQNVNLNGGGGTLTGTYNIKGNINTGSATAPYTFSGTVNLLGTTGTQSVGGASGTPVALTFATLVTSAAALRNQTSPTVTVSTAVTLGGGAYTVGAHTLSIGGTSSGASLDASAAGSTVNYTSGSAQAVLASTYGGTLGLSGAGAKSLGGVVTAAVVNHVAASGALTIGNAFTINGNNPSNLDAIAVSAATTLDYQGNSTLTIATVSSINATGIIQQSTLAGTIAFTNPFTNGGTIRTGTGTLTFNGDLTNTGGTVTLTSTGIANFAANILAVGTMNFAATSTVNYTGAGAQSVAGVTYGNLNMSGAGVKTALGAVSISTAFSNGSAITDMSTFALGGAGTKTQAAGGTMRFGGAANGIIFAAGTVEYNGVITQTITGNAATTYATLLLSGTGTKSVLAGAANTVHTTSSLTVGNGITLDVAATGVVQVDGDLTLNGTGNITNAGAITVGV